MNTKPLKSQDTAEKLPWLEPHVRADVKKSFMLRLSEPDYLKLKYAAEQNHLSINQFCLNAILPAIQQALDLTRGNP